MRHYACALLLRDGRILLGKRSPHRRAYANKWDVIGGLVAGGAPFTKDVWNLAYSGYLERLRAVLAEDPARARVDWDTWSPLLWLPPHDEDVALEMVTLFVHHGADPHRRDSDGVAPIDRAEALGMARVVAYLRGLRRTEKL